MRTLSLPLFPSTSSSQLFLRTSARKRGRGRATRRDNLQHSPLLVFCNFLMFLFFFSYFSLYYLIFSGGSLLAGCFCLFWFSQPSSAKFFPGRLLAPVPVSPALAISRFGSGRAREGASEFVRPCTCRRQNAVKESSLTQSRFLSALRSLSLLLFLLLILPLFWRFSLRFDARGVLLDASRCRPSLPFPSSRSGLFIYSAVVVLAALSFACRCARCCFRLGLNLLASVRARVWLRRPPHLGSHRVTTNKH